MRISDWSSDVCSSDLIQGSAGCNRFNGEYQERRDTLIAGQLAVTRMMCQGNAMTVQSRFLKILGGPVTVQQPGQTLTLRSREGSVQLRRTSRYERLGPAPVVHPPPRAPSPTRNGLV